MKYTVALLALAAAVSAQTPPGCSTSFSGSFEIAPVNITGSSKRDLAMYKVCLLITFNEKFVRNFPSRL